MINFEYENSTKLDAEQPPWRIILSLVFFLLVFVIWLAASSKVVRSVIYRQGIVFRDDSVFATKMLALSANRERVSEVFIGSSRIHRQIDPTQINAGRVAAGCQPKAYYNLGVGGGSTSNSIFLANWVLQYFPDIERVWIEPYGADQFLTINADRNVSFSPRFSYDIWMDRLLSKKAQPFIKRSADRWKIFRTSFRAALNYGLYHDELTGTADYKLVPHELGSRGYLPLDFRLGANASLATKKRQIVKKDPDYFRKKVSDASKKSKKARYKAQVLGDAAFVLNKLPAHKRDRVGLIYSVASPRISYTDQKNTYYKGKTIPILTMPSSELTFLNEAESYFDTGHLTHKASQKVSKFLGRRICDFEKN